MLFRQASLMPSLIVAAAADPSAARQTNIVWAAFVAAAALLDDFELYCARAAH